MVKLAQFGAGFIGKIHAANVAKHPKAELIYIYIVDSVQKTINVRNSSC